MQGGCVGSEGALVGTWQVSNRNHEPGCLSFFRRGQMVNMSWQLAGITNRKRRRLTGLRNRLMKSMRERMTKKQLDLIFGVALEG